MWRSGNLDGTNALFKASKITLPVKKLKKGNIYVIKTMSPPVLNEWQIYVVGACYPDAQAGRLKPMIFMGAWHLGHLNTGLDRSIHGSIKTCKII